jgi:TPR repeat protein
VTQDYAQAKEWYGQAAAQGNASAQCNLGFLYDEGEGVGQAYAEVKKWYERAAAQGHANAKKALDRLQGR